MCRILIVDDIEDNVLVLQALLEAEGYVVETAESGWAALRKLKANPPDVVLLDVMMPDMTGYEVTERIRENQNLAQIPIVLVTAYSDVSVDEALSMGANDFIRKPIDYDQLLVSVKNFCNAVSLKAVHQPLES
jgi:CheY-like chemotaxis protein